MLIIFSGLPGVGKTTLSKVIASKLNATYLRVDSIEQSIKNSHLKLSDVVNAGYLVAYNVAKDNLSNGNAVVADSVNPVEESRKDWLKVAEDTNSKVIEFEVICSDEAEHKRRVENRVADIQNHQLPSWRDVVDREYAPWSTKPIVIDTFNKPIETSLEEVLSKLSH